MAIIVCPHCGGDIDTEGDDVAEGDVVNVIRGRSNTRGCYLRVEIDDYISFRLVLPPINCTRILRGNSFVTGSPFPLSAKRNGTRDTCNLVFTTFRPVLPQ